MSGLTPNTCSLGEHGWMLLAIRPSPSAFPKVCTAAAKSAIEVLLNPDGVLQDRTVRKLSRSGTSTFWNVCSQLGMRVGISHCQRSEHYNTGNDVANAGGDLGSLQWRVVFE